MPMLLDKTPKKDDPLARLRALQVDTIVQWYKDGDITARDKHDLLIAKGHAELKGVIEKEGIPGAYFAEVVKQAGKGWENIKNIVGSPATAAPAGEMTARGQL